MDNWINILDENILKSSINFAALFVLNFECLKDFVVSQVREFYSGISIRDGELYCEESEGYKKEVRALDKNIENASLHWFMDSDAINEEDYNLYQKIRQRRNDIIHKLLRNLSNGFSEEDAKLFEAMLGLYQKIDKWWINEIEIPISGELMPDDYDHEQVFGGQAMVLKMINDIVLDNNKGQYKEVLDELMRWGIIEQDNL